MLNSVVHCFPCIGEINNSYADGVLAINTVGEDCLCRVCCWEKLVSWPIWRGTMKLKVKRREMISRIYHLDDDD